MNVVQVANNMSLEAAKAETEGITLEDFESAYLIGFRAFPVRALVMKATVCFEHKRLPIFVIHDLDTGATEDTTHKLVSFLGTELKAVLVIQNLLSGAMSDESQHTITVYTPEELKEI